MSDGEEGVGEESEDEHELEGGMEGSVEEEVGRSGAGGPLITMSWVEYNLDYNRENMGPLFDGVTDVGTDIERNILPFMFLFRPPKERPVFSYT